MAVCRKVAFRKLRRTPVKSTTPAIPAILLLLASAFAFAEEPRSVSVDGSATISVAPDRATLRMAIESRNAVLDTARGEVIAATRAFLDFADEADIEDDDVQTSGLSIRPEYRWDDGDNRQVMTGYVVQREIVVELRELDSLGEIIEGAIDKGVNQVQPPDFRHSNENDLRRQALARATEEARANAAQIARTLGVTLGSVRRVTANASPAPEPRMLRAMAMSEAAPSGADTYSIGQIAIEARVSAEFDLETPAD